MVAATVRIVTPDSACAGARCRQQKEVERVQRPTQETGREQVTREAIEST